MGIFSKTVQYLKERLGKTRNKISSSLSAVLTLGRDIDEQLLDELEETLIYYWRATCHEGREDTNSAIKDWRAKCQKK